MDNAAALHIKKKIQLDWEKIRGFFSLTRASIEMKQL